METYKLNTKRLKDLRLDKQITQKEMADRLGVTRSAYSNYELGITQPPASNMIKLAEILGSSVEYLTNQSDYVSKWAEYDANLPPGKLAILRGEIKPPYMPIQEDVNSFDEIESKSITIPVLSKITEKDPYTDIDNIYGTVAIPEEGNLHRKLFALVVFGQSMEPTIQDGDIVIIQPQTEVRDNEIAVALTNTGEVLIKRIRFSGNGITLVGDNVTDYPPAFYNHNEIKTSPIRIIGKVVELRRNMN